LNFMVFLERVFRSNATSHMLEKLTCDDIFFLLFYSYFIFIFVIFYIFFSIRLSWSHDLDCGSGGLTRVGSPFIPRVTSLSCRINSSHFFCFFLLPNFSFLYLINWELSYIICLHLQKYIFSQVIFIIIIF